MRRIAFYPAALQEYRQREGAEPAAAAILHWHIGMAHLDDESWGRAHARFELVLEGLPGAHQGEQAHVAERALDRLVDALPRRSHATGPLLLAVAGPRAGQNLTFTL